MTSIIDTEIATLKVRSVSPDDPVSRAMELMRRRGVKHMPVVSSSDGVAGIISFRDVMREALARRVGSRSPT